MTFKEFLESDLSKEPHFLLFGNPVSHSVSPIMHNTAISYYGLRGRYIAVKLSVDELELVASHLNKTEFLGANITIPHKENFFPLVDQLTDSASKIGAINTIVKNQQKIIGDNTDAYGFKQPLAGYVDVLETDRAIVFGSGGATKAIVYALNDLGFDEVCIVSRKPELVTDVEAIILCSYDDWQHYADEANLIINATPLGMIPNIEASPVKDHEVELLTGKMCYDLVYNPEETKFLKQAKRVNGIAIGGLEMLIHQGDEAFFKWTGKRFPIGLVKMKLDEHFSF